MTDDEYEALEERAAIIQFCSGREVSRETAWRMACDQAAQKARHVDEARRLTNGRTGEGGISLS